MFWLGKVKIKVWNLFLNLRAEVTHYKELTFSAVTLLTGFKANLLTEVLNNFQIIYAKPTFESVNILVSLP